MYIPSLDPSSIAEEEVVALNPITLPQSATGIPFEAALAFGQPPDVIATYTGIVQVTDDVTNTALGSSATVTAVMREKLALALNGIGVSAITATMQMDDASVPVQLDGTRTGVSADLRVDTPAVARLDSLVEFSALPAVTSQRKFLINAPSTTNGGERRVLLTVALPHKKGIAPDAKLRLWARPLTTPLLNGFTSVEADLTVTPALTFSADTSLTAYPPGVTIPVTTTTSTTTAAPVHYTQAAFSKSSSLYANIYATEIVGNLSVTTDGVRSTAGMEKIKSSADLIARLSGGTTTLIEAATTKYLQSMLEAGTGFTADDATRRITLQRCTTAVDLSAPTDGHYLYVIDETSPKVTATVPKYGGFLSLDLAPLLTDTDMVYSFVLTTDDTSGFLITNQDGGFPWRRPTIVYGDDWRSSAQPLPGSYLASIVTVEQSGDAAYPVPYFPVSEAKRIATDWNQIAAYNDDPDRQFTLVYNEATQEFDKVTIDSEGYNVVTDTIAPIRLGTTLLYPLLTYDLLWVIDRSTELDRIREIIFATSSVSATGQTSGGS